MGDTSVWDYYMNNHTLFQQDCDSNNSDVSSVYGFINKHSLSKFDDSSNFMYMDDDVEEVDVSSRYGYMKSHTVYQHNDSKSLMNNNCRDDMNMNANLHYRVVISGIGLLNSHNLFQYNE